MQIRRLLADNGVVAMLLDRHFGRDRIDVTFFGRQTGFLRTPAMIGYLSGAPLLPAFMIRQADDRFAGVLGDPIVVDSRRTDRGRRADRDAGVRGPARGPDSRAVRSSGISSIRTGAPDASARLIGRDVRERDAADGHAHAVGQHFALDLDHAADPPDDAGAGVEHADAAARRRET